LAEPQTLFTCFNQKLLDDIRFYIAEKIAFFSSTVYQNKLFQIILIEVIAEP
jgi:hypothetical protein